MKILSQDGVLVDNNTITNNYNNRNNFGVYQPSFNSINGFANKSGTFAIAGGGGLIASTGGSNATGDFNLPKVIDLTKPFKFTTLLEYNTTTGTTKVSIYNSSNTRSVVNIYINSNGISSEVGYTTLHNSLNTGLVNGQKYWFNIVGDGTVITISLLPLLRYGITDSSSYNGPVLSDYYKSYSTGFTEGGNSTFVGWDRIKVENSSTTCKILSVFFTQENKFFNDVNGLIQSPFIMCPTISGDNTPIIRIPKSYNTNTYTDLVVVMHPNGSDEKTGIGKNAIDTGTAIAHLVEQGYIVITSLGATDGNINGAMASNWGCYNGLKYRYDTIQWCLNNLNGIRNIYGLGLSMGGLNALSFQKTYPSLLKAIVGISPVTNLTYAYNSESFSTIINSAYTSSTIASIQDNDVNLRPELFVDIPIKIWHGTSDTLIHKANHADLFKTNVEALGGNVTVVSVSGAGHLDTVTLLDGPAIKTFFSQYQ